MKFTSTIWYDTNSEPPKNYIWYKDGKHWAYNNETKSWEETVIDEGVYTRIDGLEERIAALEELIPEGGLNPVAPEPAIWVTLSESKDAPAGSAEEVATGLQITVEELEQLPDQLVIGIHGDSTDYVLIRQRFNKWGTNWNVLFGAPDTMFTISFNDGVYNCVFSIV